jgi:VanZ family protein
VGKSEIRVVHVPRWFTVSVWLAVTAAMVLTVRALSGRAYERDTPLADILAVVQRYGSGSATSTAVLATIAPAIADILFFVPWGALGFLSLDSRRQPQTKTYGATIALGVAFALALLAWQVALPMRITGGVDALWNVVGCASGAALGQARKRVRIRFE